MYNPMLLNATYETLYMIVLSGFFSIFFGLILGILLFITAKNGIYENLPFNRALGIMVNITRSIPFIILLIMLIPLTRYLLGTSIGTNAAIIPLTIAAIPFYARVCENAFLAVPKGLIETAEAYGANLWQTIVSVVLPESAGTLVRGATLTLITLVGYSAMAGAVGGGGLGELAINYGYQRFDTWIMFQTVCILIVLVQCIQLAGDLIARRKRLKPILVTLIVTAAVLVGVRFVPMTATGNDVLKVGVMSGWPEEVMKVAAQLARQDYHLGIQTVTFNDYVQPNIALANGSIDANIFQHLPYLNAQLASDHLPITPVAKTFVYPMGFYSTKIQKLDALPNDGTVAIPNDPSNGARALLLLQKYGLIQLKPNVGTLASVADIIANPKNIQFKQLDAAQLPRVLPDVDLAAITNDFLKPAGLKSNQALIREGADSPYANIIVVRDKDKNDTNISELINVMHSNAVLQKTEEIFPDGAAIPAFK